MSMGPEFQNPSLFRGQLCSCSHIMIWNNLALPIFRVRFDQKDCCSYKDMVFEAWSSIQHKHHYTDWISHTKHIEHRHCIDCQSKKSHLLWAGGREVRKPSLCISEGDVLRGVTVRWRKMTLHLWWQWERGRADSYPNSFPCRSVAQNQSRRQWVWCTGRTVTPANRAPRKEAVKEKRHFTLKWCLTASESKASALCMQACFSIFFLMT